MLSIYAKSFMTATRTEPFKTRNQRVDPRCHTRRAPPAAPRKRLRHLLNF